MSKTATRAIGATTDDTAPTPWLTQREALDVLEEAPPELRIGKSERSLTRYARDGEVKTMQRSRPGRPPETLYCREDLERLTAHRAYLMEATNAPSALVPVAPAGIAASVTQALAIIEAVRSTNAVQAQPSPPVQAWLDLEAASAHSGLSARLLRKLVREGLLAALRDGKAWKVHREDLDNLRPRGLAAAKEIARSAGGGK